MESFDEAGEARRGEARQSETCGARGMASILSSITEASISSSVVFSSRRFIIRSLHPSLNYNYCIKLGCGSKRTLRYPVIKNYCN